MSACSQCGTVVKPADKFCNVCGSPITRSAAPPDAGSAYGGPPAPPPFVAPEAPAPYLPPVPGGSLPAHCQMGHEMAPGASYCPQGHPIALDQLQFVNENYGGGYGQPPAPQAFSPQRPQQPQQPPPQFPSPQPPPPYPGQGAPFPYGQPLGGPPQAAYAAAFAAPAAPAPYQAFSPQPSPAPPPLPPITAPPPFAAPPQAYGNGPSREAVPPRLLRGFLVAYGTNPSGDFWPLTAGRLTVGRFGTGDSLDIPLQDPTISSRHAALAVDGPTGTVTVEDTGSTNGTFVNDEHIGYGGRRDVRDGDRLRFGGFTTIVKVVGRV